MVAILNEIRKKIVELSNSKEWDELVIYLKEQLEEDAVNAQDILTYAQKKIWSGSKEFVVDALAINSIGLMIEGLPDEAQAKLAPEFYKLAGDRGDDNGCRNYAICLLHGEGIKQSPKEALDYVKKAVELNGEDTHQLILYDCLREHHQNEKAYCTLENFLNKLERDLHAVVSKQGQATEEEKKYIFKCYDSTIKKISDIIVYPQVFVKISANTSYTEARWCFWFLTKFIRAERISDKLEKLKLEAIAVTARILKEQARILLGGGLQSAQNVQFYTDLKRFWSKEETWFYSVDEEALRRGYEVCQAEKIEPIKVKIDSLNVRIEELEVKLKSVSAKKTKEKTRQEIKALNQKIYWLKVGKTDALTFLSKQIDPSLPGNRRSIRTHKAESWFFDFSRSKKKKQILELTNKIIDQRVRVPGTSSDPIELANISTRILITAEKLFQAVMMENHNHFPYYGSFTDLWLPIERREPWDDGRDENCYAPPECYKIGETQVKSEHRTNPKSSRLGDSYVSGISNYNSICQSLLAMTNGGDSAKTKKIAEWMIRYGNKQQPVTLEELQGMHQDLEEAQLQDYIDKFNKICFLVIAKEQAQWIAGNATSYQLGMAVAQARGLIMMKAGFITLEEVFSSGALFGVYTGSKLADDSSQLAEPCKKINDLYLVYLQGKKVPNYVSFFKQRISEGKQIQTTRTWVLTREQAHQDLKTVYGGDSDTDGEEYISDLDEGSDLDVQAPIGNLSISP